MALEAIPEAIYNLADASPSETLVDTVQSAKGEFAECGTFMI
jgi:hypothetical protein